MKQRTELQERRYWFGEKPKWTGLTNDEKDIEVARWLIARVGKNKAHELIDELSDPMGDEETISRMYGQFYVECHRRD